MLRLLFQEWGLGIFQISRLQRFFSPLTSDCGGTNRSKISCPRTKQILPEDIYETTLSFLTRRNYSSEKVSENANNFNNGNHIVIDEIHILLLRVPRLIPLGTLLKMSSSSSSSSSSSDEGGEAPAAHSPSQSSPPPAPEPAPAPAADLPEAVEPEVPKNGTAIPSEEAAEKEPEKEKPSSQSGNNSASGSGSGIGSLVASHYNSLQEKGKDHRKESRIFHMRNLNNWIKVGGTYLNG